MATKTELKPKGEVYYATGKRKNAIARVRIFPGTGRIVINNLDISEYLQRRILELIINQPFEVTNTEGQFDVLATVDGGGKSGQAGAIRHGIARALEKFDEKLRAPLKKEGHLTRDDRIKERKKYGRKRARRGFQWTKR
ncbi:MAG: 30S ribosomal protein S9 [Vulcanimicrobiota bacterium]